MSKTVVGLFKSTAAAQEVKQILSSGGYLPRDISIVTADHEDNQLPASGSTDLVGGRSEDYGIGHKIGSFFKHLTGGDEHAHEHYAAGVNAGGALLTVETEDEEAEQVAVLLKQHGARDIEGGAPMGVDSEARAYAGTGQEVTGTTAIPIVEEQMVVGKREVDRGGVRVYSHVVERPVEADVTLRDERINVERRTVNRPATAADFDMGKGSDFELRATGEEAVVGKNSRVVEEVLVGKQASDHTEAIHDTVRKTEVEVEQLAGQGIDKARS